MALNLEAHFNLGANFTIIIPKTRIAEMAHIQYIVIISLGVICCCACSNKHMMHTMFSQYKYVPVKSRSRNSR